MSYLTIPFQVWLPYFWTTSFLQCLPVNFVSSSGSPYCFETLDSSGCKTLPEHERRHSIKSTSNLSRQTIKKIHCSLFSSLFRTWDSLLWRISWLQSSQEHLFLETELNWTVCICFCALCFCELDISIQRQVKSRRHICCWQMKKTQLIICNLIIRKMKLRKCLNCCKAYPGWSWNFFQIQLTWCSWIRVSDFKLILEHEICDKDTFGQIHCLYLLLLFVRKMASKCLVVFTRKQQEYCVESLYLTASFCLLDMTENLVEKQHATQRLPVLLKKTIISISKAREGYESSFRSVEVVRSVLSSLFVRLSQVRIDLRCCTKYLTVTEKSPKAKQSYSKSIVSNIPDKCQFCLTGDSTSESMSVTTVNI